MHPDNDFPERHLSPVPLAPVVSLRPRTLTRDEFRRLDEALRSIESSCPALRGAIALRGGGDLTPDRSAESHLTAAGRGSATAGGPA